MTVSSTTRKAGPFTGDGVVDTFPFAFKVFSDADVLVVSADADGIETTLTIVTDYTVDLNTDQDVSPGGDVILNDPLTSGHTMIIGSDVSLTQLTEITNGGAFYPRVINSALDKLTILVQQIQEQVSRALMIDITSDDDPVSLLSSLRAVVAEAGDTVTVNTFAEIDTALWVTPRFVVVLIDETNSNLRTTYFYDGATLNWVPLVGA